MCHLKIDYIFCHCCFLSPSKISEEEETLVYFLVSSGKVLEERTEILVSFISILRLER